MRPPALVLVLVALAACPRTAPKPPSTPTELTREDRLMYAQLEVQRDAAIPKLTELADDRLPARRALAMRALGRIGSPAAVAELRRRLVGQEAILAAAALGIAGATGAIEPADAKVIVAELAALPAAGAGRIAVLEAIGRLGTTVALAPLSQALGATEPGVVVAAAIGLGRLGRAKIGLGDTTELALIGLTKHALPAVRYAATYALARGFVEVTAPPPAATDAVVRALRDRVRDAEAVIRATAVAGLVARRAVAVTTPELLEALDDGDWRVGVELVRALGGAAATDATRAAVVPYVARVSQEWTAGRLPSSFGHVLLESLRQLADRSAEPAARAVLVAIARGYADQPPSQREVDRQMAAAWANCLALGALARPLPTVATGDALNDPTVAMAQLGGCGGGILPDLLAQGVALEAIAAGAGGDTVRRLAGASASADAAVAAAALALLPAVTATLTPPERLPVRDALVAALGRAEPAVAGAAADAAAEILKVTGASGDFASVAAAVLARIDGAAGDAELTSTLLAAVAAAKLDGLPRCQRLADDASPALRTAARDCITALTGTDPGPRTAATPPVKPPIDPALALQAIGAWHLTTTAGELVIGLEGTIAPWHVAAIITLTRSGYYDGLLFHRVVPNFVVQGGDPTGTGWGGPGFTLPSETTASLEEIPVGFDVGSVGIADAGKDTGGSQWFAMHSPAPHLEGRYTWVGRVIDGADVLDRIQVGDRIIRARFE
ncbi:MAG: peptidylprolyl isomerase [Myxococcales bacterium]|nr:peptidylprolyl isomerase [Myxococcales bacterium]